MKNFEQKLSSEQCRRIMFALESGPKTRTELVKLTRLTQGSIVKHLTVLVEAKLAIVDAQGVATKST